MICPWLGAACALAVGAAAWALAARGELAELRAALLAERDRRTRVERALSRFTAPGERSGNPPWQEAMHAARSRRDAWETSEAFEREMFGTPSRRFPHAYNLTDWEAHVHETTPSAYEAEDTASHFARCTRMDEVVIPSSELTVPLSAAVRARALTALTECGYVVLDDLIAKDTVRRFREGYFALRDSAEGGDFRYPCQGQGRVEHMLPFAPPFNDSGVFDDPRLLDIVGDFLREQFKLELMTVITSPPGSGDQRWHQGWRYLFHPDERLPPYALVATMPLVDVDIPMGPSQICPGRSEIRPAAAPAPAGRGPRPRAARAAELRLYYGWRCHEHMVSVGTTAGTLVLFDYKTLHRGPANRATSERPMVSMVFSKVFFLNAEAFVNRGISLLQTLHQRRYWELFFYHPTSRDEHFDV